VNLTLHVWRQPARGSEGKFVQYDARDISPDASFLEMLDVVNEGLIKKGEDAIAFGWVIVAAFDLAVHYVGLLFGEVEILGELG